ncbi:bestrophin-like domain [Microvirga rosea]|uniref:bestrophin-like domain n=1 Tax=Microvirga rosea TaxID=2715425 RepID=UPI001D0A72D8|nr:DUF4239 domain-containing protein [Microvirga rosea]MCB8822542.1 DUF4239 domain-containing protein [Microvirga rosea]
MIFDTWLDMPVWGIFASLAVTFALSALLIYRLSFGAAIRPYTSTFVGVVAPFFGAVAVLFALLTGFLANEVWERDRQAMRTVLGERGGLVALQALSTATVTDMEGIRETARSYAEALIQDEWPRMRDQESSAKAGQALLTLLTQISNPQVAAGAGAAAQTALLDTVLKLRSARDDRLALSGDQTDRTKWTAVLILAFITQVAIGVVHLERPRAQLAALTIFSTAAVITLGLIAIRERPFDGIAQVSPQPIVEALRTMTKAATP